MTKILNDPGCATTFAANTGTPGCPFHPDQIVGAMLVPNDKVFSNAELDTFVATCQTLMIGAAATRVYPIFRFDSIKDNTEDPTFKKLGYGGERLNKEGRYIFEFEMSMGGHCHNNKLRAFNNDRSKKVIFFDKNNIVLGAASGADGMKGMSTDHFYAYPFKVNQGEEAASYRVKFALDRPNEFNEDLVYFDAETSLEDAFTGCLDIEMYNIGSGSATKKQVIGIRTICDKVSLYDAFSASLLANFDHIFTATLVGVADNPTGAVLVPALKGVELTFPSVGVHVITMASPSVLAATPIFIGGAPDTGYDCLDTLTVTIA
jgi:hypothetical protein